MNTTRPLLAVLVAALALTGCGVPSSGSARTSSTAPATSAGATDASSAPSGDAAATPGDATPRPQSTAAPELGQPVARKTITRKDGQFTLSIYQPTRDRDLVTLVFDLTLDKYTGDQLDWELLTDPGSSLASVDGVPNTLRLLDPVGHRLYLPATSGDGQDTALCSPNRPGAGESKQGDTYTFSCIYAGVPASLSKVTLRSYSFGSIPDVTIR